MAATFLLCFFAFFCLLNLLGSAAILGLLHIIQEELDTQIYPFLCDDSTESWKRSLRDTLHEPTKLRQSVSKGRHARAHRD